MRSRDVAESKSRRSRGAISPASIVASLVISRIVCIGAYSILCDFGADTSFYAYTRIYSSMFISSKLSFSSITLDNSRIVPAIFILSILCSSYIIFLRNGIHNIPLLSAVTEKRVSAPEAHKYMCVQMNF